MMRILALMAALVALCPALAVAQNLALRAPAWAQPLVAADVTPTTGGRAMLAEEGIISAVRVAIAPHQGGVARVIRFDVRDEGAMIALRRFTGHPATGWWLWGSDAPLAAPAPAAARAEVETLARAAAGVAGSLGAGAGEACADGEQAFVEIAVAGRAVAHTRACVSASDAVGRLALRLSELAGSRTEEELAAAAVAELLAADRAFAAMAQREGVPAAFVHYAASDALIVTSSEISSGRDGVRERYARWAEGARLQWAPELARVSARGDMGWTWGNSTYTAPDGAVSRGRYVSVWTRDHDGAWRYAFDAPIR